MRIAVVASLSAIATARYLVQAFRRAGHELLAISDVRSADANVTGESVPDVAAICAARDFAPQLALFIEGGSMRLFPLGLERLSCPTAWYGIDTHTNYKLHLRLARLFDATFVAQKMFVDRLVSDGVRRVHWLPFAFPPDLLPAMNQPRRIDLAFVGSVDPVIYPERVRLLEKARAAVATAEIGPAAPEEMMRRYAQAKIVLNRSYDNDVNMRYFEAMGAGAVLLTDPAVDNGAEELFEAGKHYLVYRSEPELLEAIRWVLYRPEEARAVGVAARREIEARHTYDHRVAQILGAMHDVAKEVRPDAADYFAGMISLKHSAAALQAAAAAIDDMGRSTRRHRLNRALGAALRIFGKVDLALSRVAAWTRR